jgi:hypothetical protein
VTALVSAAEYVGVTNADITIEHIARLTPITDQGEVMRVRATPEVRDEPMLVGPHADWVVGVFGVPPGAIVGILDSACWFAERLVRRLQQPDSPL